MNAAVPDRGVGRRGTAVPRAWRQHREDGIALVAVLLVLVLMLAVAAGTLGWTRSQLFAAGRARSALQARYTAEAGIAHAVATLAAGTSFAAVIAGTGGLVRSWSPGPLHPPGGGVAFPGPPHGYAVAARALSDAGGPRGERMLLVARGTAVRGAAREVHAVVGRSGAAAAPAALVLVEASVEVAPGGVLSVDAAAPPAGRQAIAAAPGTAAVALLAALRGAGARLVGAREAAPAVETDVGAWLDASGIPSAPAGAVVAVGGAPGVVALRVEGSVGAVVGRGVVAAGGDLEITGRIDLDGVLIVGGELRTDDADCRIAGMVIARRLRTAGCDIRFDADAIAAADAGLRLPRAAEIVALTDG